MAEICTVSTVPDRMGLGLLEVEFPKGKPESFFRFIKVLGQGGEEMSRLATEVTNVALSVPNWKGPANELMMAETMARSGTVKVAGSALPSLAGAMSAYGNELQGAQADISSMSKQAVDLHDDAVNSKRAAAKHRKASSEQAAAGDSAGGAAHANAAQRAEEIAADAEKKLAALRKRAQARIKTHESARKAASSALHAAQVPKYSANLTASAAKTGYEVLRVEVERLERQRLAELEKKRKEQEEKQGWFSKVAHVTLDAVGTVDPTGAADLLNAGLYAAEGDTENALLSLAGVIPIVGDGIKYAGRGLKAVKGARQFDGALTTIRNNAWDPTRGAFKRGEGHWDKTPFSRGNALEGMRRNNLPDYFKTFDHFSPLRKTAISYKSVDLRAPTYNRLSGADTSGAVAGALERKMKRDIDSAAQFTRYEKDNVEVVGSELRKRSVEFLIPRNDIHRVTAEQQRAIDRAIEHGTSQGVKVKIVRIK